MGNQSDIFGQLFAPQEQVAPVTVPAYLRAADNHNLGNIGSSWFDVNPGNIPKFAAVSMLSGVNSFYNTGVAIGNFFGAGWKENKTDAWISSIDSDLGAYYRKNEGAADLMGFVVSSFVPGMAGIKVLNAGQKALAASKSGFVGSNLGIALGLKTPQIETYITAAAKEITAGQATFTSISQSGYKALAAGVYQNVLEGAAFETVVQATMQKSPILDEQSRSDVVWNIATGGFLGGAIGGAFASAKTLGAIKKQATELYAGIQPFGSRALYQESGNASNKLILLAHDLESGPVLNPTDPQYSQQLAALQQRQNRISLDMRETVHSMVKGKDTTLGRMIADINVGQSADDVTGAFIDTHEIARLNTPTVVEAAMAQRAALGLDPHPAWQIHYWKLTGEGTGTVLDSQPGVFNLADRFAERTDKGSRELVLSEVRKYGFSRDKFWDPLKMSLAGSAGHLEAEARQIWAAEMVKSIAPGTGIGLRDFPMLERALNLGQYDIKLIDEAGGILKDKFMFRQELQDYIVAAKKDAAIKLQETALARGKGFEVGKTLEEAQQWTSQKIGKIINARVGALEGTSVGNPYEDFFAWQQLFDERSAYLRSKGLSPVKGEEQDPRFMPTWAKVTKVAIDREIDGTVIDGLTWAKLRQQVHKQNMDNVVAKRMGDYYNQLPELTEKDLSLSDPFGTGATLLGFNNPKYGGPASKVSLIGSVTKRATQAEVEAFADSSTGVLTSLARNQEAVIEWGTVNQKASRSALQFVIADTGEGFERGLISKAALKAIAKGDDEFLINNPEHFIPVKTDEAWDLITNHIDATSKITQARNERSAAQGLDQARELGIFRPIPADPKDYPFFAFVKDPKVTGQGHTSMIFASTEKDLKELAQKAQQARPDLQIVFKKDTEDFFKARQSYEYDRTLSENYIDSSLRNEGIYSSYFTKTDPQAVVDDYIRHHNKLISTDIRETVRSKYQAAFDWWEDQAKAYSRIETSKFGGNFAKLEAEGKNPYLSYIKTALNISRINENPLWYSANVTADKAISKVVDAIDSVWSSAKGQVTPDKLDEINALLKEHGINTGYYDAATNLLVNHTAPKGELTKFIRGANAVLAKLTLALDPLNSLVNAIGANVLRTTELRQVTAAIREGNTDIAGEIARIGKIDITGQGDLILSPAKLISNSFQNFIAGDAKLTQFYKSIGVQKSITEQFRAMLDDFTLTGTESASVLQSKLKAAIQKADQLSIAGEKYTGNKLAEEMNRFISADVMRQLTDPAVAKGVITPKEQIAYINTFVNRVEGNIIASQRPLVFQGPIGQAVGLFQSYQFNLMQQMFRYVSEGSAKDAAMMLGLQGTFFGIQGLPAFQAINQHVIGTASGNKDHKDLYDATYGIAGKQLGDLLTYGLPSNLLQTNLYSRGDINPRQVTILPTALNEVPVVGAFSKFFGSMKETLNKISGGANAWQSFLQGVEHNGISRPLSGLAQTLQATTGAGVPFSTTSKGSILFSNDLMSLATLSRIAGGRPLDEAIVNDGVYRINSYQQYDRQKMLVLAEAVKASSIQGQEMSNEQWTKFSEEYAKRGGKQVNFNKFMMQEIKAANTSQAEKIVSQLQNPFAQKMQLLMGGE